MTFVIGLALLGLAAWVMASQGGAVQHAWSSIRSSSPWLIGAALALPVANLAVVSLSFWLLMRREGPVTPREMLCLIGAAWLLNFVPLRPGLVGRLAYHRAVNRIPVHRAVWVTLVGIAAGGAAVITTLLVAAAMGRRESGVTWMLALGAPVGAGLSATGVLAARRCGAWIYAATYVLRYLDILIWIARYAVLFMLIGSPTSLAGAVVFASVCQVTLVVPLIGNGLGIREWAIALTAAALPAGLLSATGSPRDAGLMADLVNRATEVVLAIPIGLACTAWLTRRVRLNRLSVVADAGAIS